jgi:hypothetical protein
LQRLVTVSARTAHAESIESEDVSGAAVSIPDVKKHECNHDYGISKNKYYSMKEEGS